MEVAETGGAWLKTLEVEVVVLCVFQHGNWPPTCLLFQVFHWIINFEHLYVWSDWELYLFDLVCLFVCLFVYQKVCFAYICSFCLIIQYTLLLLTLPSIHFLVLKWYTNRMEEAGSQKHMLCFCCPVSCCEFYSLRVTYKLGQQLPLVNCKSLSRWRCSIDFFHINDQWWKNTTSEFQISNGDTLWFIYIYIYIDWY